MTDSSTHLAQSVGVEERSTSATSNVPPAVLRTRSIGVSPCPTCGERVDTQASECPACGEHLRQSPRLIHCAHCGTQASSELLICPGCCRELRAAPSPVMTWGAPVAIVLLFLVLLGSRWQDGNPVAWVGERMDRGVALVENLGESLEPQLVIAMTPIAGNRSAPVALALSQSEDKAEIPAVMVAQADAEDSSAGIQTVADELAALGVGGGVEESAVDDGEPPAQPEAIALAVVEAPTATDVPPTSVPATPMPLPTATALPTQAPPTALPPTVTATPAATSTPAGMVALSAAEAQYEPTPTWTPMATVVAAGAMVAALPTPTTAPTSAGRGGQPIAAAVVAAAADVEPTATPVAYQVRAGDTLMVIARRYDVTVEALMAANGISSSDVTRIQPGRLLIIPQPPTPTPTPSPIRLEATAPIAPEDGATVDCRGETVLSWERILYIQDSDKYLLHMGFVSGVDATGAEMVTWVVAQQRPVTSTEWTLDSALCNLASQTYDRQWRWWVEVVAEQEGKLVSVSPPSPVWGFRWD